MRLIVGCVVPLNDWWPQSGYAQLRFVGRGFEYRRKLLARLDPRFAALTPEETTALQYASQDNPLFELFKPLFVGERARWIEIVRDPRNRRTLAANRDKLTVDDRSYWLGDMNPHETGRMLEAIARGTIGSNASCEAMTRIMRRQQLGARRLPHCLEVPIGHQTGASAVVAN